MSGITNVTQNVCINAEVNVRPQVTVGEIFTFCDGGPFIGNCKGTLKPCCSFNVCQNICVEVPLTFEATAEVVPNGLVCQTPRIGKGHSCMFPHSYFASHKEVINKILKAAGGTIVLGALDRNNDPIGLSLIVNATNADAVFNGSISLPLLPTTSPLYEQYKQLYQQLLTANLNVKNGVTSEEVLQAISKADTFLASSQAGGTTGASALSVVLEAFNSRDNEQNTDTMESSL